jgi:hypothetical protein
LISQLAGRDQPGPIVGQQEIAKEKGALILDDPRFHFEVKLEDGSCYKWLLVPDTIHGIDMEIDHFIRDDPTMDDARLNRDLAMEMIADWLFSGPFEKNV